MILRSAFVFPHILLLLVIELGSDSELRFPHLNKRVDVRSENQGWKYRRPDYFWSSPMLGQYGWVGENKTVSKSNQYPTRGLFSILPFPMHGWRESTHRSEVRRPDNQSWIGLDTVDTGKSNKQRWIGAGVLSEWKQTNGRRFSVIESACGSSVYFHPTSTERSIQYLFCTNIHLTLYPVLSFSILRFTYTSLPMYTLCMYMLYSCAWSLLARHLEWAIWAARMKSPAAFAQ